MEKEKSIECPICGEIMDKYIYMTIIVIQKKRVITNVQIVVIENAN
ncbi:hypothetical protein [Clostridium butyricum]|nr:hypothetical protein [Clostridium butyricum]MDB2151308.1 hypothetical protein [Clostridium butyricum]